MDALDPRNQCADGIRSACPSTAPNRLERQPKPEEKAEDPELACSIAIVEATVSVALDFATVGVGRLATAAASDAIRLANIGRYAAQTGRYATAGAGYFALARGARLDAAAYGAVETQLHALHGGAGLGFAYAVQHVNILDFIPGVGTGRKFYKAWTTCNPS